MKFYNSIEEYNNNGNTIVTLGKFDGFHRGHQRLLDKVKELKDGELKTLVLSINLVAYKVSRGYECAEIMNSHEKAQFLEDKVDYFLELQFTKSLKEMGAEEFVEQILVNKLKVKHLVVGQGFQFGVGGEGNIYLLRELAKKYGFELHVVGKLGYGFETISSTYVRMEIKQGRMEIVSDLLGYHYGVVGVVEHGKKLGRTIGFPTLNIPLPEGKVIPPRGVYICRVYIDDVPYFGMGNLGVKPTVSQDKKENLEVHVLKYSGDAYGKRVQIQFLHHLRMEQKFDSIGKLTSQIKLDLAEVNRYISNYTY